jgi:hypothetical protein
MDVRTSGSARPATDELVLRRTLERREYLEAVRPSVALRVWRSVRNLVVLIGLWAVLDVALMAAEITMLDRRLPSLTAVITNLARVFRSPEGAPLVVLMSLIAVFVVLTRW